MTDISNLNLRTIVFHGPSGSGKDTQLDLLENKFSFERIAGSQVMKTLKKEGNSTALEADKYGKEGKLYPDNLMYEMLATWLERAEKDSRWIFLSPVRKETQIKLFDELLSKYNRELDLFVHFSLSKEKAIERMSLRSYCPNCSTTYHELYKKEQKEGFCDNDGSRLEKRADDKPESISRRLEWYESDVGPILNEYEKRGILLDIDASPPIEEIHETLVDELSKYVS